MRVIGFIDGLRGLGGVNLVTSLETARALDTALPAAGSATYFLYDLRPGTDAADILQDLGNRSGIPRY